MTASALYVVSCRIALCSHSNDFNRSDDRSRKSILLPEISRPMIMRHANKPTAFGHTERFNHSNSVGLRWLNEIITVSWLHIFDVQKLLSHFLSGSAHPSAPNRLARKLVLLDLLNLSLSVRQASTLLSPPTATMMEGGRKLAETPSCCWLGKAKHVGCDAKAAQQNCRPEGDVEREGDARKIDGVIMALGHFRSLLLLPMTGYPTFWTVSVNLLRGGAGPYDVCQFQPPYLQPCQHSFLRCRLTQPPFALDQPKIPRRKSGVAQMKLKRFCRKEPPTDDRP